MSELERKSVLIVDDDRIIQKQLCLALERNFFKPLVAGSGETALALLRERPIEIVIQDVKLPDMSGLDVIKEAKKIRPDCEIIVITGFGTQDIAIKSLRLGAIDYIEKPIDLEDLSTALGRAKEKVAEKQQLDYKNTLLVVDDQKSILLKLSRFLEKEGFSVFSAQNGEDAFKILEENKIDILITDYDMPGLNGIEVMQRCKQLQPDIESIMVTGHRDETIAVNALRAGAIDYLPKPVNLDELLFSINKSLKIINLNRTRLYRNRELKISKEIVSRMNEELEKRIEARTKELSMVQSQLFQTSKLATLGEMAAGLAHEINQPLAGISLVAKGFHKMLERGKLSEEFLADGLADIEESVNRMSKVIKHIRTFARQDTLKFIEVDLNKTVHSALGLLGEQLRLHNIKVRLKLDDGLPKISGEPYQIEQVWINLISNARDALDEKERQEDNRGYLKRLTIKTSHKKDDKQVLITFSDNGIGLTQEQKQKIFEPFYTTKEVGKGSGLGLSISYGIIQNHKGNIGFVNGSSNETEVRVTLPV